MTANATINCDLAIIGGGLAGGLIARAIAARRPEINLKLVEAAPVLGGNHIWCFFDSDITPADRWLVEPLIAHRWDGYDVAFPAHARSFAQPYNAIESERFDAVVRGELGEDRVIGARVDHIAADGRTAVLGDGGVIEAAAIIDARGPGDVATLDVGWQKFVGQLLRCREPHGLVRPTVMDATVEQIDGYRFVYCLPFDATHVFVEDTYYSDTPDLDEAEVGARIAAYAAARGWRVEAIERREKGVLPVVIGGDFERYWTSTGADVAKAGMRGAFFHPTTGYSLPDAVRLASRIAAAPDLSGAALARLTHDLGAKSWHGRGFYRMLDVMLFRAARPDERYRIMERFYRLDAELIGRFYSARTTLADKLRILVGKPPIPIPRALAAIIRNRF